MKIFGTVFLIMLSCFLFSQKANSLSGPVSQCNWDRMSFSSKYVPDFHDTCLFVATIRNFNSAKHEFVDYDYDTTGTIKYFAVYFNGNRWTAVPYPSLPELMNLKSDYRDLVILTEGLGKTFTSGIDRATRLLRIYAVDGVFFDWPTERPYMRAGKNIKTTSRLAPQAAKAYAVFLNDFQTYKNAHKDKFKSVTLLFHSMGNLLLMNNLKNNALSFLTPSVINAVVLNAACVNQTNHNLWLDKLTFTQNVYVTINDKDKNLRGARIIFGDHQIGEKPKKQFSTNAAYVNFSPVLDKEHNYYVMQPLLRKKTFLYEFYADIFSGKKPRTTFPSSVAAATKDTN
jgi:hypothetical protein